MRKIKVTVRVELGGGDESGSVFERTILGDTSGDDRSSMINAEQGISFATSEVLSAVQAAHGKAPADWEASVKWRR